MFYVFPPPAEDIQQGDIFVNIPRVELPSLRKLMIIEQGAKPGKLTSLGWDEITQSNEKDATAALVGLQAVPAIVITQTCDAARKPYVTLCEIMQLSEVKAFSTYKKDSLKKVAGDLIKHNRNKPDIFYLPPDSKIGFTEKMVAVFSNTIRVGRDDLERLKQDRTGRLNDIAYEHFREKLAYFFHRYAFNEWYILSKEELEAHKDYCDLDQQHRYNHQK